MEMRENQRGPFTIAGKDAGEECADSRHHVIVDTGEATLE